MSDLDILRNTVRVDRLWRSLTGTLHRKLTRSDVEEIDAFYAKGIAELEQQQAAIDDSEGLDLVCLELNSRLDEVLDWWHGYCGDVIPNEHYHRLRPELYKILGKEFPEGE